MRREFAIVFLIALFTSAVGAISVEFESNYAPSETMIGKITGNLINPLQNTQVEFKRANVRVPLEFDIVKVGNAYYLWAVGPQSEGNYTLIIHNVATTVNGVPQSVTYERNFSILGEMVDYYIRPGAIVAKQDFVINVRLNEDDSKVISTDFPAAREITLNPGDNIVKFSTAGVRESIIGTINLGRYMVAAYIIGNKSAITPKEKGIIFVPSRIYAFAEPRRENVYDIVIYNQQDIGIEKLAINYDRQKFELEPEVVTLKANESTVVKMTLKNDSKDIEDRIFITYNNSEYDLPVYIFVNSSSPVSNGSGSNNTNNGSAGGTRCYEVAGKVCTATQECKGSVVSSVDGQCCLGYCVETEKTSRAWIGYSIGILVLLAILFAYFKYRQVKISGKKVFDDKILHAGSKLP